MIPRRNAAAAACFVSGNDGVSPGIAPSPAASRSSTHNRGGLILRERGLLRLLRGRGGSNANSWPPPWAVFTLSTLKAECPLHHFVVLVCAAFVLHGYTARSVFDAFCMMRTAFRVWIIGHGVGASDPLFEPLRALCSYIPNPQQRHSKSIVNSH